MARKSRKHKYIKEIYVMEKVYSTAVYARLSVMDGEDENSINTQVELIRNYIDLHSDLDYTDTYIDNGYTGTDFSRPAFTRLIDDIRGKKINCIVVKDMSRFGRNYIEAGYYIETVFPFLKVRLIAINDNFDSNRKSDMDSLVLPIKNMINMMYARDISKKVWTALQQKKKNGCSVGNTIPYGYIRNKETHRNEINESTGFYVHIIFQWKLDGISVNEIRCRLDTIMAPTPRKPDGEERKGWSNSTISAILKNQTYIGDTVSNKTDKALYSGRSKTVLGKEHWIITKNTHDAIVAGDDFANVQKIFIKQAEKYNCAGKRSADNVFGGIVFCADCGKKMKYERYAGNGYYICRSGRAGHLGRRNRITERLLKILTIRQMYMSVKDISGKGKMFKSMFYDMSKNISGLTKEIARLREKKRQLYEEQAAGKYTPEDYKNIKDIYSSDYERIRARLAYERSRLADIEDRVKKYRIFCAEYEKIADGGGEDNDFLKKYVRRIEVGSNKKINIITDFADTCSNPDITARGENVV